MRRNGSNVLTISAKSKCPKGVRHLFAVKQYYVVGRKGEKDVTALDCVPGIAITLLNVFK